MSGAPEGTVRLLAGKAFADHGDAAVVAFRAPGWSGKDTMLIDGGRTARVRWCGSVLELRELVGGASPQEPLVVLTQQADDALGADMLAVFAGQRVRPVGVWEPLMEAFDARRVVPRLSKIAGLGEALLHYLPGNKYPPAPNGVLSEEHAWDQLIRVVLGVVPASAAELLECAAKPEVASRLQQGAPGGVDKLIEPLIAALTERVGRAAEPIVRCVSAEVPRAVVPVGLAAAVVFSGESDPALTAAGVRFESCVGGAHIAPEAGREFAHAAKRLTLDASDAQRANWVAEAEGVLREIIAFDFAWTSDVLPGGFTQRFAKLAAALDVPVGAESLVTVSDAVHALRHHSLATTDRRRVEAAEMAARLWALLGREPEPPGSFEAAAALHVQEGGYVDLAREALDREDPEPTTAAAYRILADRADVLRAARAAEFANLLRATTNAETLGGAVGVEQAWSETIGPAAKEGPILLILLDGLSESVFRGLKPTLLRDGWIEISPAGAPRKPTVAALPSVTQVSRASLMSGSLTTGEQRVERDGFAHQATPVGAGRLFHRADVGEPDAINQAIADAANQVVGVVVNAIDDRLAKGDQLDPVWSLDAIAPLPWLLASARDAQRAVVLAGDHGHVLERGSEHVAAEGGGNRWRPAGGPPPRADEVLLEGSRVLKGEGRIIAPATERLRYRTKAAGYHGGATPQEVIAPLAVFAPMGVDLAGWDEVAEAEPEWWTLSSPTESEPAAPAAQKKPRIAPPSDAQIEMFDPPAATPAPEFPDWIAKLFETPSYRAAVAATPRVPSPERIAALLILLERTGKVPESAASQALNLTLMRVPGAIASIQSLLNLEGYQVISRDRSTGEVSLDKALLTKQFGL